MQTQTTVVLAVLVLCVTLFAGCYSPMRFQSDSADLLVQDFWSSPRYRVVFDGISVAKSADRQYSFRDPPSRKDTIIAFNLTSFDDLEVLARHRARAQVIIEEESEGVVFDETIEFEVPETGRSPVGFTAVQPPSNWGTRPKGEVIVGEIANERRDSDAWTFSGSGHVIEVGTTTLGPHRYTLRIRIHVDREFTPPVLVYPIIAAEFKSVL